MGKMLAAFCYLTLALCVVFEGLLINAMITKKSAEGFLKGVRAVLFTAGFGQMIWTIILFYSKASKACQPLVKRSYQAMWNSFIFVAL